MDFCRDRRGYLIGDKEDIKKRWREYFEELLNVEGKEKHNQEVQYMLPTQRNRIRGRGTYTERSKGSDPKVGK
jgi:hypothetical protein